jgi:hypothetical protein
MNDPDKQEISKQIILALCLDAIAPQYVEHVPILMLMLNPCGQDVFSLPNSYIFQLKLGMTDFPSHPGQPETILT